MNALACGKTSGGATLPLAVASDGKLLVSLPTDPTFTTITLSGAVSNATQGATKAYVDAAVSGASGSTAGTATRALKDTLYFSGDTASARAYWATGTALSLATSTLSVVALVGNNATSAAVVRGIWAFGPATTAYGASSFVCYRNSNNLVVELVGATAGTDFRRLTYTNFFTTYTAREIPLVVTWSRTAAPIVYADGAAISMTETTGGTAPAWTASIDSTYFVLGVRAATEMWNNRLLAFPVNTALTAAEVAAHSSTGRLPPAVEQSGAGVRYTADWSAGVDGWQASFNTAIAGNIDSIGGRNDTVRATIGTGAGSTCQIKKTALTIGRRYRLQGFYYLPSAQTLTSLTVYQTSAGAPTIVGSLTVTNTWTAFSAEFDAVDTTFAVIATPSNITGNGTDVFYLSAVVLTEVGPVFSPVVQPIRIVDDARNGVPGVLASGVSPITLNKTWRVRATVDTSAVANVQVLGAAFFETPTSVAIDSIDTACTGTPTFSLGDGTTATKYTASVAHTATRYRESISANYPADSAKTGIYCNVTSASAGTVITISGHLID